MKPYFAEFVHEKTDPGTRGADHFRKGFLTEGHGIGAASPSSPKFASRSRKARKASLAAIEQLVDQVVFNPAVS